MRGSSRRLAVVGLALLVVAVGTTAALTSRGHPPAGGQAERPDSAIPLRTGTPDMNVVRIGYSTLTPLHCALGEVLARTDILLQHGLKGEFHAFPHGSDQDRACADGVVDATFSCEVPAMIHLDRHPRFMIAGSLGGLGDIALVVAANSPSRSLGDLMGKRVEVVGGASAEVVMEAWLRRAGLSGRDMSIHMASGNCEDVVQALAGGRADAGVLWDPWLTQFLLEGRIRMLDHAPFWSLIFVDQRLSNHADDRLTRYVAAVREAADWIGRHPDQAATWASERSGLPKEVVRTVLAKAGWPRTPAAVPGMEEALLERLRQCEDFARRNKQVSGEFRLSTHLLMKDRQ